MGEILFVAASIAVSLAVTTFGYAVSRRYVRDRLKYVDAVQTMKAPILAGVGAWLLLMPFTFLPFIGIGTAMVFGLSVGLGVKAGANDIRIGRLSGGF